MEDLENAVSDPKEPSFPIEEGSDCEFCGCADTCRMDRARESGEMPEPEDSGLRANAEGTGEFTVSRPVPPTQLEMMVTFFCLVAVCFAVVLGFEMLTSKIGFNRQNPLFLEWIMWAAIATFFGLIDYEVPGTSAKPETGAREKSAAQEESAVTDGQ